MKAQFFIISSVIIIYITMLSFQYLSSFSDIKLSNIEEQQELSYIQKIKSSIIQTYNTSNYTNNGDLNMIAKDIGFNKKFLNEEILKRGVDFDSKFIFFSNGFETGLSKWQVNGGPQLSSETKYDGTYSLYSYGLENVSKKLDGVNEVYARVYVNFNTLPTIDQHRHYFLDFYDSGTQILGLGVYNDNNVYKIRAYSTLPSINQNWNYAIDIRNGEWHYFELYWYENGTNSRIKAWYDGTLMINLTRDSDGNGKSVDEYRVGGVTIGGGSSLPNLYVDCVAIGSDYIGSDCYPDEEPYFAFSLKTNEMYTKTEFPYAEQEYVPPSFSCGDSVLCLKFDEGSGNKAYDSSSYGNNGTLGDGNCPSSGKCPTWRFGSDCIYGSCLYFDGVSDFVNVSASASLNISNITIAAWIYPYDWKYQPQDYSRIVDKRRAYYFYIVNESFINTTRFYYYNSTDSDQHDSNLYSIQLNKWQYVAVTYDGQYVRFYVNGTSEGQHSSSAPGPLAKNNYNLYVGNAYGLNRNFNGTIDEVRIWNRALSQLEIQDEMNRG